MTDEMLLDAPLVPFLGGPADGLRLPVARPLPPEAWWSPGPPAIVMLPVVPGGRLPGAIRYLRTGTVDNTVYVCEDIDPAAFESVTKEASCQPQP